MLLDGLHAGRIGEECRWATRAHLAPTGRNARHPWVVAGVTARQFTQILQPNIREESMLHRLSTRGVGRRTVLKAGLALGAAPLAGPFIINARGEEPIKIGFDDPLTG